MNMKSRAREIVDRYLRWTNTEKAFFEVKYRDKKMYALIDRCENDFIIFMSSSNGKLGIPLNGTRLRVLRNEIFTDRTLESIIDGYYSGTWKAQRQALVKRLRL